MSDSAHPPPEQTARAAKLKQTKVSHAAHLPLIDLALPPSHTTHTPPPHLSRGRPLSYHVLFRLSLFLLVPVFVAGPLFATFVFFLLRIPAARRTSCLFARSLAKLAPHFSCSTGGPKTQPRRDSEPEMARWNNPICISSNYAMLRQV